MKDIRNMCTFILSVLVSVVMCGSCQQELEDASNQISRDGVVLSIAADTISTRTHWDGKTIMWSAGDQIAVGYVKDGIWSKDFFESSVLDKAVAKARFTVQTDLQEGATGKMSFYAVNPASCLKGSSASKITVNIPADQTVKGASYDPAGDIMTGVSYYEYDKVPQSQIPLLWKRHVAHADIVLTGISLSDGEKVQSVIFTADDEAGLVGEYTVDLNGGDHLEAVSGKTSGRFGVDVSALSVGADGKLNLWACVAPVSVKSLQVKLCTSCGVYTRDIPSCEMTFSVNARNKLNIDMAAASFEKLNPEVFELLDLDYPGLEKVKAEYQKGDYATAADALVEYFRDRTSVVNAEEDITAVKMYAEDKNIAAQALEHRFCVRRGHWYESVNGTSYTYWDFDDAEGNINWDFHVEEAGQEFYQKHWHAWFKFLAWSQVLTGDDKYFDSWREVYTDWLETYPCPGSAGNSNTYGNRSWHQLSVATRISNQLNLFPYFITSDHFTGGWMSTFLTEFHKAVEFCRSIPYYEETSNIRFAQQTAEAKAAMLFPEFKDASKWLADVAPQISAQFSLQFYSDGVHTEMAPNYQLGVMDNFRVVYQTAKLNGRLSSFDPDYTEKMHKACTFLANYVWPDYTWEWFNDTFQQTKNVLLNSLKRYSAIFPEDNLLKYLSTERAQGTVPAESLISFPAGGYYILRTGWTGKETMMILKNNYNPENEWHCHMDNGTFALWSNGRNFMPDPGVYTYGGSTELDAIRVEHLATASHNTLTKNLESIAKNYSKGECLLTRTSASEDLVVTQNASYSDLTHRRAVYMLDKKFYVIVDEAFGNAKNADVNVSFHLCKGTVKTDDHSSSNAYGVHTEFADGNDMLWRTFSETSAGFVGETGTSRCSPKQNEYYDRTFYRVTVDKRQSTDVARFITVIYPSRTAEISASFQSRFSEASSSVKVVVNGKTYNLSYSL